MAAAAASKVAAAVGSEAVAAAAATPVKKVTAAWRQGKRNLFELVTVQPKFGVGARVMRTPWAPQETYFTLTKVSPSVVRSCWQNCFLFMLLPCAFLFVLSLVSAHRPYRTCGTGKLGGV